MHILLILSDVTSSANVDVVAVVVGACFLDRVGRRKGGEGGKEAKYGLVV